MQSRTVPTDLYTLIRDGPSRPYGFKFAFFPVRCPDNEVLFDSTGVILSPGFPENYPNQQMCSWMISVEKGYNITLHFELFQTEKEFDILEIFDGT